MTSQDSHEESEPTPSGAAPRPRRRLSFKGKIFLLTLGILLALVVGELAARFREVFILGHREETQIVEWNRRFELSPGEIYRHRPGEEPHWKYKINSDGFRGEELPPKEHEGVRVAFFGDSMVFGYGVDADETWPVFLEQYLNEQTSGTLPIEVINLGRKSISTVGVSVDVDRYGDQLDPDAVVFSVAWYNEFQVFYEKPELTERKAIEVGLMEDRLREVNSPLFNLALWRLYKYRKHIQELRSVYFLDQELRADGAFTYESMGVPGRVPVSEFREDLRYLARWCRERNLPFYFTLPVMRPDHEEKFPVIRAYVEALQEIVPEEGGTLIDTRQAILEYAANRAGGEVWIDWVHTTPPVLKLLAEKTGQAMLEDRELFPRPHASHSESESP